jgi:hypothetical protein
LRVGADKEETHHTPTIFLFFDISLRPFEPLPTTNISNTDRITMSLYDRIAFPLQAPNPALQRSGQSSSSSSSFATEDKIRTLVDEYGQRDDLDEDEKMWLSRECIAR